MKFLQSIPRFALAVLMIACGSRTSTPSEPLPELPEVRLEAFQSTIRAEVKTARDALLNDPDDSRKNAALAKILHAHQQNATAEVCYDRARILEPERFDWVYLLAMVQSEQGKDEAAMANLRRALELDPAYVPALVKLADLSLKTGHLPEAGQLYRDALERDPQSAIAWYGLGRVQTTSAQTGAAAESFEKACELFPNYGQAHYALALAYRKLKRLQEAKEHFALGEEHKLEMPPTGDRVLTEVRRLTRSPSDYLRAGVELDKKGRLEESLAVHLEVLKIDPDLEQAHINLISLYGRLGKPDKALEHYRKAMKLNENLPDCHYNYGVLMFSLGKPERAKAAFEKAIEINPFYAKAHHNLGTILEGEGHLEAAAQQYRLAIENRPGYRLAHFHLGRILVNQGKADEAIGHFRQILEPEDADTPGYLYALGIACARTHQRAEAVNYIRQARDLASKYDQWELLASIEKDLATLEGRAAAR